MKTLVFEVYNITKALKVQVSKSIWDLYYPPHWLFLTVSRDWVMSLSGNLTLTVANIQLYELK